MNPEKVRRPSHREVRRRRKSAGRHPLPAATQPAALFPYVIRRAAPGLRHRIPLERGERPRSLQRRLQRLADEWSAELCLVLSERQAVYFAPGRPPKDSDRLPTGGFWGEPTA